MTISSSTTTIDNDHRQFERIRQRHRQQPQSQNDFNADNARNHTQQNNIFEFTSRLCIWRFNIDVRTAKARYVRLVCVHESRFSAIDVESAFRSAIGWLAEHNVWHIEVDLDRYFKW
jgi:hypothetical protein